jgi:NADH:ubiquinone oxidoreductase subunit 6 (subunit J)
MSLNDAVFLVLAGSTIAGALGVVSSRNIIHSALYLILAFLGVAGIYFTLGAGFLGLVQILVYAGAVAVLIIFAIMLVMDGPAENSNQPPPGRETRFWGITLAALLTLILGGTITSSRLGPTVVAPAGIDTVGALAELMLGRYVVAFEAVAILLLLAVVGAIILARGVEKD